MQRLTEMEFKATCGNPMRRITDGLPPFDFWSYFEAIPEADFEGNDCSEGAVDYVWRDPTERFEHVLVNSRDADVFMALVLDLNARRVCGHRLMNFRREYGLED